MSKLFGDPVETAVASVLRPGCAASRQDHCPGKIAAAFFRSDPEYLPQLPLFGLHFGYFASGNDLSPRCAQFFIKRLGNSGRLVRSRVYIAISVVKINASGFPETDVVLYRKPRKKGGEVLSSACMITIFIHMEICEIAAPVAGGIDLAPNRVIRFQKECQRAVLRGRAGCHAPGCPCSDHGRVIDLVFFTERIAGCGLSFCHAVFSLVSLSSGDPQ